MKPYPFPRVPKPADPSAIQTVVAALLTPDTGAWQSQAACAETDPEVFYPEKGGSHREAKAICAACPVRTQCLEYALRMEAADYPTGVWGGMSPDERLVLMGRRSRTRSTRRTAA